MMMKSLINFVHSRVASDALIRHSAILFGGMLSAQLCSLVYQMAVSRALPAEEYALLAAFLGVLYVLQLPLNTLMAALSRYSSLLVRYGRRGDVKRLVFKWGWICLVPAVILSASGLLFSRSLASLLHLERAEPVIIAAITLPALFLFPVLNGTVQGMQIYVWNAAAEMSGAFARLSLGAGFVWFLYPTCGWAMLGHGFGVYTAAAVLLFFLFFKMARGGSTAERLPSLHRYVLQSLFIQSAYALLMTADVVLVKHYLPFNTDFAYAATLGRLVVFLPGAIVAAMFPKVSSDGGATANQRRIFRRTLFFTAACVLVAVIICSGIPGLMLRFLFGLSAPDVWLQSMSVLMACVMAVNALLNVLVQYMLARHCFLPLTWVVVCAAGYIGLSAIFHSSSLVIVALAGFFNLLAFVFLLILVLKHDAAQ